MSGCTHTIASNIRGQQPDRNETANPHGWLQSRQTAFDPPGWLKVSAPRMLGELTHSPANVMKTKKIAGMVLAVTAFVSGKFARHFASVDIPMATSAPVTLRTVPSSCWARLSWTAKMSSLTARSRNAYGPPKAENGRIATTKQHKRVESTLAIARLWTNPVLTRADLRADKEDMRDGVK